LGVSDLQQLLNDFFLLKVGSVTSLERQERGDGIIEEYLWRKEDAEFRNCVALGSGLSPTIFIHYYYFYGKRNLQQFIFLQALACQIWIQC
jgi:hypothetical protein